MLRVVVGCGTDDIVVGDGLSWSVWSVRAGVRSVLAGLELSGQVGVGLVMTPRGKRADSVLHYGGRDYATVVAVSVVRTGIAGNAILVSWSCQSMAVRWCSA